MPPEPPDPEDDAEDNAAEFARLLAAFETESDTEERDEQSMALLLQAMAWGEKQEQTPRDTVLEEYSGHCEMQDWVSAEDACRRLIALSDEPAMAYRAWHLLAGTLFEQERYTEALAASRGATDAARKSEMAPLVIMALREEISGAERAEEFEPVAACLEEGLALTAEPDKLSDWIRAGFLIFRAQASLRSQDTTAAATDLREAEPVLTPYADSMMMAGPLSTLGLWWNTRARLLLQEGDTNGAKNAAQEALWISRRLAEMPQLNQAIGRRSLARSLSKFAEFCEEAGDTAAAEAARQESLVLRTAPTQP